MPDGTEQGLHNTLYRLTESLRSYIEAAYHIRDESLIRERRLLLDEDGSVCQTPYVESTPIYELGQPYAKLQIPDQVKAVLTELAALNIGLYPRPYIHQARALEQFFLEAADLIVATGTGSGKTESFLMPIIGQLVMEAAQRPESAQMSGCRAILLYPMNALVNDQLSRIRKLFGEHRASAIVSRGRRRPIHFGSYTGRTPYPGLRSAKKDGARIEPLFEGFYLPVMAQEDLRRELESIGQWPAKDLAAFYAKHQEERTVTATGKPRHLRHWDRRLRTQSGDRELMIRHETQIACPDLLITNYSMLEYMLMRPIERQIFSQTRTWLHSNPANELIMILDEAHMYRGAGGAEVALLLRRLFARLEVPRERVRFILTSASLGQGEEAERAVKAFARDLTGLSPQSFRPLNLITGLREARTEGGPSEPAITAALAEFDLATFEKHAIDPATARQAVNALAAALNWPHLAETTDLADYLFHQLTGFPPLELLIELVSGTASPLPDLQQTLFPNHPGREKATASLLALATFARRGHDQRVLLPTRLHTFFRGLPGLFACVNPQCDCAREQSNARILGKLHTQPRNLCDCHSRVYELLTHRECGTAFIRGYMRGVHGDFLWDMPSGPLRQGQLNPLTKVELLVGSRPHEQEADRCVEAWLDVRSGQLAYEPPSDADGFVEVFLPAPGQDWAQRELTFGSCPVCRKRTAARSARSTIMDHSTKGEAPFANLVKTQLDTQPAAREETRVYPNGGRKVLLFSDGRQKAARLARDIPREVELDIFRQILAVAATRLNHEGIEARPTYHLYIAVLTVLRDFNLPIFDRGDATRIGQDIQRLERDHPGERLSDLINEFAPGDPPTRYKVALMRQLCGRYYSITGSAIGAVRTARRSLNRLKNDLRTIIPDLSDTDIEQLTTCWIAGLTDDYAFDVALSDHVRADAAGFWTGSWGSDGRFDRTLRTKLPGLLGVADSTIEGVEGVLTSALTLRHQNGNLFLEPNTLKIQIDLEAPWFQCQDCTAFLPTRIRNHCASCGSPHVNQLAADQSEYIRSRKGFWREPVKAALRDGAQLRTISVEEHTAQLSNRDNGRVHATTEQFELRFRDVLINQRERPIDVLSCTTTMEVGVDIGSLVAVGLRNVPPQRENYQQRAGRAGRRGSSVSTVLTYAQNGPHDNYYYHKPWEIVAGPPRNPEIKIDNPKIAKRHITSFLFQTFFHRYMDEHGIEIGGDTSALFRALGKASDFFFGDPELVPEITGFWQWVQDTTVSEEGELRREIRTWLPDSLRTAPLTIDQWIGDVASQLINDLRGIRATLRPPAIVEPDPEAGGAEEDDERIALENDELLEFLFSRGMLPSYAFPTDLTSFLVEQLGRVPGSARRKVEIIERPQQSIEKALSEYAPGRLVVINKETYRSGGVVANVLPTFVDRALPLFEDVADLIHCDNCSYIRDLEQLEHGADNCPVCNGALQRTPMIVPQVFTPEDGRPLAEDDREQDITYATSAQFPVPVQAGELPEMNARGSHLASTVSPDCKLVTANKGQLVNDNYQGFWICEKCGRASTEQPAAGSHKRPYPVEFSYGQPPVPQLCNGTFHNVFLGHVFSTDLLLLRMTVTEPLVTDTTDVVVLRALEDSLYSVAEALRLCASRHPQLDLDPSEFGAGFRIVPNEARGSLSLDIYLYDTLSGGAGYAELADRYLDDILVDVLNLLEHCPARCDRSCESCLRHYHNQHLKERLDRHVAAQLLRYALHDEPPRELATEQQVALLTPLKRMLQLDGFDCQDALNVGGVTVPLLVEREGRTLAVGIQSGLLTEAWDHHTLKSAINAGRVRGIILQDYLLRRNLPDNHQLIRAEFGI